MREVIGKQRGEVIFHKEIKVSLCSDVTVAKFLLQTLDLTVDFSAKKT